MKTIQKAQKESQEHVIAMEKKERMNTVDTSWVRDELVAVTKENAGIQIRVTTQVKKESSRVGMGIIAINSHNQVVIA